MILAILAVIAGLVILVWGADRFVDGAASTARYLGMPPLLIGMVILGFGTSAPEMVVSALAAMDGNAGIGLGNAYGSNIVNIALILGVASMISPIKVSSSMLSKELPILTLVTILSVFLLSDLYLSRQNAVILLAVFFILLAWAIVQGMKQRSDSLAKEVEKETVEKALPHTRVIFGLVARAIFWLAAGLVLLVAGSRMFVWGAVAIAGMLGVSDLIIGLTVAALGTSLPELASSILAARKGEHELALGNVIGSNLFNTLAVVGISGVIHPVAVEAETLYRDMAVMGILTLSLFVIGYGFRKKQGRINRFEGGMLFLVYVSYTAWLAISVIKG